MLFNYKAVESNGTPREGSVDAVSIDVAISSIQRRGYIISSIVPADGGSFFTKQISFFDRVANKDIVILSRQVATLFEAQVSALRVFRLLGAETENKMLARALTEIGDDLQAGSPISKALEKHPKIFSSFYINMVRSGEESGKLDRTFGYLADYLDRSYEIVSKTKNALVYPAFIVATFIGVMALMLTVVIPKISTILTDSGQEVPIYTQIVLNISYFFVDYGIFVLILAIVGGFFLWRWSHTPQGGHYFARLQISIPYIGELYRKLYLSRISDNMHTMIESGIPILKAVEVTADVVDNATFRDAVLSVAEEIKGGVSFSDALSHHAEIPGIMVQMAKVGEETGELGNILKTMSGFYRREVTNAVDTLVGLIEPVMIVLLGLGVGTLLASVLIPIYNIASGV